MPARPVYLFDDGLPSANLSPLTDLRAAFDVRTGVLTTFERLVRTGEFSPVGLFVPDVLADLTREPHPMPVNIVPDRAQPILAVNGRWTLPRAAAIAVLREPDSALIDEPTGTILAASLRADRIPALLHGDTSAFKLLKADPVPRGQLLIRPWHVRSGRDAAVAYDLSLLVAGAAGKAIAPVASVSSSAKVHPSAVLDTEGGHIHIDAQAVVRPGAIMIGPCAVGANSTVLERATIRPNTVIGPSCKVAGEVSGVIFQGYANKAHDGFLGDSWIGEWVNLGAGTTNSNLLNTYGEVIALAVPGGSYERTGEQFLGAIIGDHVKTAICTRIMTGAVIHTGAMLAQSPPVTGCISPFAWRTDEGEKQYRLSKFYEVMQAAMGRRGVAPSEAYLDRIGAMRAALDP
jgi:UDP-N-acetylglucosamine diphosphorylase / glucose-1-phosphate thymidylyltransferase / UDP-N-acetylgalactosamine diphosphorylase / glucosamine-1-phosphate N-acetyltransferase / galactosamine-1-phosphate N-acetyltransferase